MLHTHWSAEAWPQVKAEFKKAFALRSPLRRAGWLRREGVLLAVSLLSSARLLSVRVCWRVGQSDAGSAVAADYAQRAETADARRATFNQGVPGSSPGRLTNSHSDVVSSTAASRAGCRLRREACPGSLQLLPATSERRGNCSQWDQVGGNNTTRFPGGAIRDQITAMPEPATLTVLAAGLVGLGITTWRRWRADEGRFHRRPTTSAATKYREPAKNRPSASGPGVRARAGGVPATPRTRPTGFARPGRGARNRHTPASCGAGRSVRTPRQTGTIRRR